MQRAHVAVVCTFLQGDAAEVVDYVSSHTFSSNSLVGRHNLWSPACVAGPQWLTVYGM
jgi:hypothetical protein